MSFGGGSFGGGSFGGGDFGGGGFSDVGYINYSYDHSSGDSEDCDCCCKCECECPWTKRINCPMGCSFFLFFCMCVAFVPMLASLDLLTEHHYCVGGETLSGQEQMWCIPKSKTLVTAKCDKECSLVSLYRLKTSKVPKTVSRVSNVSTSFQIQRNSYKFYTFEMNPGGSVNATIRSSIREDQCFFFNYENFVLFTKSKIFTPIQSGTGIISVTCEVNKSDGYYLVVYHPGDGNAEASFDVDLVYVLYDMTSEKEVDCHLKSDCEFKDVGSDEIIIAEHDGNGNSQIQLEFPKTVVWTNVFLLCIAPGVFFIPAVILLTIGIIKCVKDIMEERSRFSWTSYEREKKKRKNSKETEKDQTTTTSIPTSSSDESMPLTNDNDSLPSYVLS